MNKIVWTQQMELGVPEMDNAHKSLVASMEQLAQLPDDAFRSQLAAFTATLERDFRSEEDMMDAIDYPALKSHREQHARVLSALHHAVPESAQGDLEPARRAVTLMPEWFTLHVATADAALAAAIELASLPK